MGKKKKTAEVFDTEKVTEGVLNEESINIGEKPASDISAVEYIGTYKTSTVLNVREAPKKDAKIICVLQIDAPVHCDGVYGTDEEARFLHIEALIDGLEIDGYCDDRYLIKQLEVRS